MRKYIEISEEVLERLESGKAVEGSLRKNLNSKLIVFNGWNRTAPKNSKVKKISDLDCGWLGETDKHITRYEKFPKSLGPNQIKAMMDRDNHQSKSALEDKYIIESV